MAIWKLDQLKRWWDDKQGKGGDGAGDGDGEDDGETPGEGEDGGEGQGKGGSGKGEGGGKPLNPHDYADLGNVKPEDANLTVQNEEGESSTPGKEETSTNAVIMDPLVFPIMPGSADMGTASTREWLQTLKTIRVSALRLSLRRLMQRSDTSGREGCLREGRLGRGVNRLLMGAENVFERRYEIDGESVAVSLLIDRSGSMSSEGKMLQAATVALLIGETAQNAGAKLEVIAFDSSYDRAAQERMDQSFAKDTGDAAWHMHGKALFAQPSAVYVCKTFAQPIGHLRRMYSTMCRMASGGTNDASALDWAGKRLLKQDANRKILFVICDGIGDQESVFRYVVEQLEQQGVICIGIGIGCDEKRFLQRFTHAVAIKRPADLCGKAFSLLIATIAKARGL